MITDVQKNAAVIMVYDYAEELRRLGYKVLPIRRIKFSSAVKCFGRCRLHVKNQKPVAATITIGEVCWHAKDYSLKSTVLHELIHAMADTENHGVLFQKYAAELSRYYHVPISTHAQSEESEAVKADGYADFAYIVECKKCGARFEYLRRSKFVEDVAKGRGNLWRCRKCRSNNFVLVKWK